MGCKILSQSLAYLLQKNIRKDKSSDQHATSDPKDQYFETRK